MSGNDTPNDRGFSLGEYFFLDLDAVAMVERYGDDDNGHCRVYMRQQVTGVGDVSYVDVECDEEDARRLVRALLIYRSAR